MAEGDSYYRGRCGEMHKLIEGCPICDLLNEKDSVMALKYIHYCVRCDTEYELDGKCKCVGIVVNVPSPIKDIMELVELSGSAKEVWNAAIEAAAKITDDADEIAARDIRKLKK